MLVMLMIEIDRNVVDLFSGDPFSVCVRLDVLPEYVEIEHLIVEFVLHPFQCSDKNVLQRLQNKFHGNKSR